MIGNWILLVALIVNGEFQLAEPRLFPSQIECMSHGRMIMTVRPDWRFRCININKIAGEEI